MTLDKEWLIISTITHIKTFRPRYYRKVTTVKSSLVPKIGTLEIISTVDFRINFKEIAFSRVLL